MKSICIGLAGLMCVAGSAVAQTQASLSSDAQKVVDSVTLTPGTALPADLAKPFVVQVPAPLKIIGDPESIVSSGTVPFGKVLLRQKLGYARTGILSVGLTLDGHQGKVVLATGTELFGYIPLLGGGGAVVWCTLPDKRTNIICLLHVDGQMMWTRSQDITLSGLSPDLQHPDAAPDPQVEEKPITTDPGLSVEYSIGDAKEPARERAKRGLMPLPTWAVQKMALVVDARILATGKYPTFNEQLLPALSDVVFPLSDMQSLVAHPVEGGTQVAVVQK